MGFYCHGTPQDCQLHLLIHTHHTTYKEVLLQYPCPFWSLIIFLIENILDIPSAELNISVCTSNEQYKSFTSQEQIYSFGKIISSYQHELTTGGIEMLVPRPSYYY